MIGFSHRRGFVPATYQNHPSLVTFTAIAEALYPRLWREKGDPPSKVVLMLNFFQKEAKKRGQTGESSTFVELSPVCPLGYLPVFGRKFNLC